MDYCSFCGKKLKMFDSVSWEIPDDHNRGVCTQCHHIFRDEIDRAAASADTAPEYKEVTDQLLAQYEIRCSQEGLAYLKDYLQYRGIQRGVILETWNHSQDHMITSGYNFEGYSIVRYIGMVSGETVMGTGLFSSAFVELDNLRQVNIDEYSSAMKKAKDMAVGKMIEQSVRCGGNAVIGTDFDYLNFHGTIIGVSVNGTSVIVEKNTKE